MENQFESESRSVLWPEVPEPRHSSPCIHCGGDHVEWLCIWQMDEWDNECPFCGEQLTYAANGIAYCPVHGMLDE